MEEQAYTYVIVGGGMAGVSAIEGIHGCDPNGSVFLTGQQVTPADLRGAIR